MPAGERMTLTLGTPCLITEGSRGDPHHERVDRARKESTPLRAGAGVR